MGVNGVSNNNALSTSSNQTVTSFSDGTITVDFNGKKVNLTSAERERFEEVQDFMTRAVRRYNALKVKQESLENQKKDLSESEKKEMDGLKIIVAERAQTASFEITPDAKNVIFKLKKDVNVEEFKRLFGIKTGEFRKQFKEEALHDGIYAGERRTYTKNGEAYSGYDDAWMAGVTEFENGVKLVEEPDGHYYPDYSGVVLSAGMVYEIPVSKISIVDEYEDVHPAPKSRYQFW